MFKISKLMLIGSFVLFSSASLAVTPLGSSGTSGSDASQSPQPLPSVGQNPSQSFSPPPVTDYQQPVQSENTRGLAFPTTPEGVRAALKLDQGDSELKTKTRSLAELKGLRAGALVEFNTDSKYMKSNTVELDAFGKALATLEPGIRVQVGGHTDDVGSHSYNMQLSRERAYTVRDFLIQNYGVNPNILTVEGYGETLPIESNSTESGKQKNRRVEFIRILY